MAMAIRAASPPLEYPDSDMEDDHQDELVMLFSQAEELMAGSDGGNGNGTSDAKAGSSHPASTCLSTITFLESASGYKRDRI